MAATPGGSAIIKDECYKCAKKDPISLHHVQLPSGSYSRMCTACVLGHHPGRFCPICFDLYEVNKQVPPQPRVSCIQCPAMVHLACFYNAFSSLASSSSSSIRFHCQQCFSPGFSFFKFEDENVDMGYRVMGEGLCKQFVCAAKISSESIKESLVTASAEAERKISEAAMARKAAEEALQHLDSFTIEEIDEDDGNEMGEDNLDDDSEDGDDGDDHEEYDVEDEHHDGEDDEDAYNCDDMEEYEFADEEFSSD